jgi:hypothetical protein
MVGPKSLSLLSERMLVTRAVESGYTNTARGQVRPVAELDKVWFFPARPKSGDFGYIRKSVNPSLGRYTVFPQLTQNEGS